MLLGTLFLLGGAGTASAHSSVRDTDPREGTVLKTAPKQVTMTFTESVGLSDDSIRVLSPDNRRMNAGDTEHAAGRSDTARVRLQDDLPEGTFTVAWRVVSADSHPISGAFTFSVGAPSETTASVSADPAVNPASGALYDIARYAAYSAVALLIGAATFVLACRPPTTAPLRKLFRIGWWTLLLSTVALLFLRGPYARGTGPSTAFDPSLLQNTLSGRPGWALLARLVLAGVAAIFLLRLDGRLGGLGYRREEYPKPAVLASGGLLAVALTGTWAAAEHASAGIQVPLAMVSSVLHLLAMAVWLGGLAALLATLHRPEIPLPASSVARFSRLAFTSVTVLVATGVYQSWRGLGSWDALTGTSYGRILIAKVCAVVLLLGAAAYSRRWTTGLLAAEEPVFRVRELETVGATTGGGAGASAGTGSASEPDESGGSGGAGGSIGSAGSIGANGSNRSNGSTGSNELNEFDQLNAVGASGSVGSGNPDEPVKAPSHHQTHHQSHHQTLRRSVLAEVLVGVAVLVITTILTGTQPGRAATETPAAATAPAGQPPTSATLIPFDVGTPNGRGKVQIVLEPGRVNENTVQALVLGPDGGVATVPEIRLTFTLASEKIGPIDAELTDQGGYWGTNSLNLPRPGTWTMKVTVRTSEIDQVTESRKVQIAP
ncbi:copper resistance protein CopC/CopD [Streptomyces sp. HC44]|uniref:Protein YobA n=1 Tax=Streptomyces scabichelini TaxID=2711217 RepID=A0A6G4V6H0_9ACTN|nr:copper resistance protein CopC/CopD [Streptomyces scabichelini]